jgi:hypothetical protein
MGSYAEHAKNCISTLDEEFERRMQVLREEHAEEVREMEAKLVSLEERYEQNLEKTLERMRQMHEHEINKTAEMVRLQCSKEYERQIQELQEKVNNTKAEFAASYQYDKTNIVELIQLIARNLKSKPDNTSRQSIYECVWRCFKAFAYPKEPNPEDYEMQVRVLIGLCRLCSWFTFKQRQSLARWCRNNNW